MTATLALIVFLLPLAYSPGPGNLFFAANGARFGLRATLPANAGYHLATWAVTIAIGLGLSGLLDMSQRGMEVMKIAGAGYVLYLAWKLTRAGVMGPGVEADPAGAWGGALLLVLNPKAYVIIALMFTQFLPGDGAGDAQAVIWIATVFTLNNLVAFLVWTLAGDRLARLFRNARTARYLNLGFGAALAGVALWMLMG